MTKKLFCVRVETDVYVAADNEDEAVYLAGRAVREESASGFEVSASEVTPEMRIPSTYARSLPWGERLGARKAWTVAQWQESLTGGQRGE